MDPLTHSATGLFLSRAGLRRIGPQAPWVLLLAANAPDVDVVTASGGSLNYLHYHRHLTHALTLLPVLALLPVLLVRLVTRRPLNWKGCYAISLAGVASHLALDWTNIYGVRLLLPFSSHWFRLDATSVVDLWIWVMCLLALAAPALMRLVNTEIGANTPGGGKHGRGFAIAALSFVLLYNFGRGLLHERAVATLESRVYSGAPPLRVAALPGPVNPLRWHGLVETGESYSLHEVNLLGEFDPTSGAVFFKPDPNPAMQAATRTPAFEEFLKFAQYPFWRVTPVSVPENGTQVEVMDLRFGTPLRPSFVSTAILGSHLEVVRAWFQFGVTGPK